jgi:hypothetical protein
MNVYADLRCLQDPAQAPGPVGCHAVALLRHARAGWPATPRLIGLVDENLPPLLDAHRTLVDEYRHGANVRPGQSGCVLLEPAPLTYEQAWLAPLLGRPGVLAAAVVHDFELGKDGGHSLTPASRVASLANLVWLKSYHRFGAVSEQAARRLQEKVVPPIGAVQVTGLALPPKDAELAAAERFWAHVHQGWQERKPATVRVCTAGKPRLAFLTPLPSEPRGAAGLGAQFFASLSKLAEVDVFTAAPRTGAHPGVRRLAPLCELPYVRARYDRVIAVVGGCPEQHAPIADYHGRYGGACLVDDSMKEGSAGSPEQDVKPAPFLEALLAKADPLLVHSRALQASLQRWCGHQARLLPFACRRHFADPELTPQARREVARRWDLAEGRVALMMWGPFSFTQGVIECLWAVEYLHTWGTPVDLYLMGEFVAPGLEVRVLRLAHRLGLGERVHLVKDRLTEAEYRDSLVAADLAIQLRTPDDGGLSGTLLDCISAGLPTIANEGLAQAMDGPDYVVRVPDHLSPPLIAERVRIAYEAGRHRVRTSAARDRYVQEHGSHQYAEELLRVLELT